MFIDSAKIFIKAGNGGNGRVSFRREKFIPAGGPDGGDGGKGGDIIFVVNEGLRTLSDFRYKRQFSAEPGADGEGARKTGKNSKDLIIMVPAGTVIRNSENNAVLADMTEPGVQRIIAHGGKGGRGNTHFATATRQAPNFARNGFPGEEISLNVELKLIADVGLIGFPNAGKSTILSVVSEAKPKIADYPFTTLEPNLGVVRVEQGESFVMADMPGLIEGAHEGTGLGQEFLRHIERTKLLIHVVDVAGSEGRDPVRDFELINAEIAAYSSKLAAKPQIVAANKIDLPEAQDKLKVFSDAMKKKGLEVFPISAATGKGVKEMVYRTYQLLSELPAAILYDVVEEEFVYGVRKEEPFNVIKKDGVFVVEGPWVKRILGSINLSESESVQYFQRLLKRKGVIAVLEEMGISEGDTVRMYDFEFDYIK